MPNPTDKHILIVDDDEGVRKLAIKHLASIGYQVTCLSNGKDTIDWLHHHRADIMLLDISLPDFNGLDLLDKLTNTRIYLPFIVMTGQGCERTAVEFMKRGASDYIIKDTNFWDLLPAAVERAFEQMDTAARLVGTESALRESEQRFQAIFNNAAAGIGLISPDGIFLAGNAALCEMFGCSIDDLEGSSFSTMFVPEDAPDVEAVIRQIRDRAVNSARFVKRFRRHDSQLFWGDISITPIRKTNDEVEAIMGVLVDITERKTAENALRILNDELEQIVRKRTAELERTNHRLEHSLARIKDDEVAGRRIQFRLLPNRSSHIGPLFCSRYVWPSMSVSGDFLDYFPVTNDVMGFYIADVSGHGVSSALVTVLLKSFFLHRLASCKTEQDLTIMDPAQCMTRLNTELIQENLGKHVTLFYGLINHAELTLTYANAGQYPPPFLREGNHVKRIEANGTPIGLFDDVEYANITQPLAPDFILTLLSDGVLEIINKTAVADKLDVLESIIRSNRFSYDYFVKRLKLKTTHILPDDIAFLCIRQDANHEQA